MRNIIVGLMAAFFFVADARSESPSANPLDRPAQSTGGVRRWNHYTRPETAPDRRSGGKELTATTAPKIGVDPWGVREQAFRPYSDSATFNLRVSFYKIEKPSTLTPGTLGQKGGTMVPTQSREWSMWRENSRELIQHLYKFAEWSDVAVKNGVAEVHKEIGQIRGQGQTLWFHRDKESGPKSWLVVTENEDATPIYRLSTPDVNALVELCDKLAGLDDQLLGRGAQPAPSAPPSKPTDSLFK
ncbi:MAG: hypothetical protein K8R23_09190 [Chthoniobacter sp.]|nr:hypothetical protein [Chthoniobacter sp.]